MHTWIPRMLTDEQKHTRLQVAHTLLAQYEEKGDEFLQSIVTTDETWVHYFTPESKTASMQWRHPSSPKPKKAKATFTTEKTFASCFWDIRGVLHIDFLTEQRTINAEYYSNLLRGPVKTAI